MSQISPPIRIVAVAAVLLIAVYMAVLRPKSASVAPAPPAPTPVGNVHSGKPAVTQFGKTVQAAQGAAKATEKAEARHAGEAGPSDSAAAKTTSSSPATKATPSQSGGAVAPAAPAVDLSGLPKPVAHAVRHHKVLALLFWNGRSADDRAVHAQLRRIERFHGAVYVHSAPLKTISRYGRITRGVDVEQSPTIVVVDRKLRATTLVGYVDTDTIEQAVVDAMRSSGGIFTTPFLRRVNGICTTTFRNLYSMPEPTSLPQARRYMNRASGRVNSFMADLRAVPAPHRWRSLKGAMLTDLGAIKGSFRGLAHELSGHPSLSTVVASFHVAQGRVGAANKRLNHRVDRAGLIYCGSQG